jgi:putative FmdB family regulatory protein
MLKLHDFECEECGLGFEALFEGGPTKPILAAACPACGGKAPKIMSAPAIHTLETHMRGYRGSSAEENFVPAHGFRDVNLTDEAGKPMCYNSLKEKNQLLEQRGLGIKESKDWTKQKRSKRPMRFTREGRRSSQLGVN